MLSEAQILERLGKICRDLPGASETVTFGHPTFQVNGKTFSVLEEYKSELGICMKVEKKLQGISLTIRAFFARPILGSTAGYAEGVCRSTGPKSKLLCAAAIGSSLLPARDQKKQQNGSRILRRYDGYLLGCDFGEPCIKNFQLVIANIEKGHAHPHGFLRVNNFSFR